MLLLELAVISIVTVCVVFRRLGQPDKKHFLVRVAIVFAASWIVEESCIVLYEFYAYSACWRLSLLHVPLLVIVVWPLVVLSAWDMASSILHSGHKRLPLVAGAIILTDALFVEPVAVHAGLWSWSKPGLFAVPVIGFLGWAYFGCLCVFLFEVQRRHNYMKWFNLVIPVVSVIGTHVCLLMTWWGALRWITISIDPGLAAGSAWALSLLLTCFIIKDRTGARMDNKLLLLRLPAAVFFFTLLALNAHDSMLLVVYGVAFSLPYLTVFAHKYGIRRELNA